MSRDEAVPPVGMNEEHLYRYKVVPRNDTVGDGPVSLITQVFVTQAPPPPTLSVDPTASTDGSFTVSWNSTGTYNELEQRTDGGSWTGVHLSNPEAMSRDFSGYPNGSYDYRVRVCYSGGCSMNSNIVTVVVSLPPAAPPSLTAPASDHNGAFTVSWSSVATADSYRLQQRRNGGAWSTAYDGANTSKWISGLANGRYDFRVNACNSSGCSGYSSLATTEVLLPPGSAPTLSVPSSVQAHTAYTVSWNGIATATRYELQRNGVTRQNNSNTSYTDSRAAGSYDYRVRACNAAGCSNWSATKSVTVYPGGGGSDCPPYCYDPQSVDEPILLDERADTSTDDGGGGPPDTPPGPARRQGGGA